MSLRYTEAQAQSLGLLPDGSPRSFSIRVPGIAAPQGSKRHVGHGIMIESSKRLKPWRAKVTDAAAEAFEGRETIDAPVILTAIFSFPRPASHFGTGRNSGVLKPTAPSYPSGRVGDLSKLIRAVEDSLTDAGVWRDDSRVVLYGAGTGKVWVATGTGPNTYIRVEALLP